MADAKRTVWRGALLAAFAVKAILPVDARDGTPPKVARHAATVISALRPIGRLACESRGTGLAVGDGLVLTAAHVLLDRSDVVAGCKLPGWALARFRHRSGDPFELRVAVHDGQPEAAALVNAGRRGTSAARTMIFAGSADYAILRTATAAPALRPCEGSPAPNRSVVVVLADGSVETRVAAAPTAKTGDDSAYIDLEHVFEQGTSGAGVLDAETFCVWGLISHRFPEPSPRVTRMTPVGAFVAAWRRAKNG